MKYHKPGPQEQLAATVATLAVAGMYDTHDDAIMSMVDDFMVQLISLAYLINKTPREACDMAFKAAPSDELWAKMISEIEKTLEMFD